MANTHGHLNHLCLPTSPVPMDRRIDDVDCSTGLMCRRA